MKSFKDIFLSEGKNEAEVIRKTLKEKFKLSNTDVSVKSSTGGYSSSVKVTIKNMKALVLRSKIKEVSSESERYDRDEASGEILMGGNTFIFVDIDYNFEKELYEIIQNEFDSQIDGKWNEGDSITLFDTFNISNQRGETYMSKKGLHFVSEVRDIKYVGSALMSLISKIGDDSLYEKIK